MKTGGERRRCSKGRTVQFLNLNSSAPFILKHSLGEGGQPQTDLPKIGANEVASYAYHNGEQH
jgi:hypothetical protein